MLVDAIILHLWVKNEPSDKEIFSRAHLELLIKPVIKPATIYDKYISVRKYSLVATDISIH
jgi:hypothetical protein